MKLDGLDHVALVVRDIDASVRWYVEVLGLEQRYATEWSGVPAFVGSGTSGVALFPLEEEPSSLTKEEAPHIRHFAWRVDRENFAVAQRELKERGIDFDFADHGVSHSIYFRDPDGHRLEITTYEIGSR